MKYLNRMNDKLHISFGSKTETGSSKEYNTDSLIDFSILHGHVFAICDGHDGANGHGALASKMVTESIKKYFFNRSYKDIATALTNAVAYANYSLFELVTKDSKYQGIGSTLAILIYRGGKVYYAYAGDSRIYLVKNNSIQLLTRDHLNQTDDVPSAEVSILLGKSKNIRFGVSKNPLMAEAGDCFLICSDGLTDVIQDEEVLQILDDQNTSPEHKSLQLIEKVQALKGKGDISVQVIEFTQVEESQKSKKPLNLKPVFITMLIIILLGSFIYGGYKLYPTLASWSQQSEKPTQNEADEFADFENDDQKPLTESNEIPYPDEAAEGKKVVVKELDKKEDAKATAKETVKKEKPKKEDAKVDKKQSTYYSHTIQAGENLYRLSLRYNVSQQKLIDLNGEAASKMISGQKLKIPITALHSIKSGETLESISSQYKIKVSDIKSANKMEESSKLKVGNELIIPLP